MAVASYNRPTVSVVMPVFNCEAFVCESIESVIGQSFPDWELVVVDDASSDSSAHRVHEQCRVDERVKLLELKSNCGAATARNVGINNSLGRYIAFLDADDIWLPFKLQRQLAFINEVRSPFSYSAYQRVDITGRLLEQIGVPEVLLYDDLLRTNYIGCSTVIYDTDRLGKVFMPINCRREDYSTWLKIIRRIGSANGVNEVLSRYRMSPQQSSRNKLRMVRETWKVYRDEEKFDLLESTLYFSHYAVRGLLRNNFPKIASMLGILHGVNRS